MNVISADAIGIRYGSKTVLKEMNFAIPRGSITGLIGVNGSGKTTLIRILLGLIEPEQGVALVHGMKAMQDGCEIRRRTGYVSDAFGLHKWMTVQMALSFYAAFYPSWSPEYANELRERVGLDPNERLDHMSKGAKTRLLLVLALSHRPELLIMDEPFSGLDPVVRHDVLGLISDYASENGRTVFLSSHNISDIERMCDRLLLLHEGRASLDGYIEQIRENRSKIRATFRENVPKDLHLTDATVLEHSSKSLTLYLRGNLELVLATLREAGAIIEDIPIDLETILLHEMTATRRSGT